VRETAEALGGRAWAEFDRPAGSRFLMRAPIAPRRGRMRHFRRRTGMGSFCGPQQPSHRDHQRNGRAGECSSCLLLVSPRVSV
jgi:hypothetical protein